MLSKLRKYIFYICSIFIPDKLFNIFTAVGGGGQKGENVRLGEKTIH
jgi:hypothetical protein